MARSRIQLKIGKKIKDFRKSKKISSKELADMLEVTPAYISQIEIGKTGVSATFLLKIKQAYPDTDMNIFFDGVN